MCVCVFVYTTYIYIYIEREREREIEREREKERIPILRHNVDVFTKYKHQTDYLLEACDICLFT